MSSVREIAEQVGLSITTVSRALNNHPSVNPDTRKRVLEAANNSGYVAAVGRRLTTLIGLAYTGEQTLAHPFDAAVLGGIARGVEQCRFDVVLLNLQRDKQPDETYTQFFMRKGIRGILLRTVAASRQVCEVIAEEGFPVMVISERFDSPNIGCIDCESRLDSTRAVEYLIALGHRRIGFAVHNIMDRDHLDRFEGYREALANHGLAFEERLVFRQKYTLDGGATVMQVAMNMPERPTAIFFADPLLAVGAFRQAHEMDLRIPGDISVVGFDDTNMRYSVHPTMTAVCQDAAALGYEAALRLTQMLSNGSRSAHQQTLSTFFEVHQSTGPPPEDEARRGTAGRDTPVFKETRRGDGAQEAVLRGG